MLALPATAASELAVPEMTERRTPSWLRDGQAVCRLSGEVADRVEIFVEVQHGEADEFGGGRDEQVWNRGRAVLTATPCSRSPAR